MYERREILTHPRFAGGVKRYHTWPTLNAQLVSDHTWQVARIYHSIFGPMSPAISTYILFHDAGELVTGDPPYPFKAHHPAIKTIYDEQEAIALRDMGIERCELTEGDLVRIKICDLIEMHEFGCVEVLMGNQFAVPIVDDPLNSIHKASAKLPPADYSKVRLYLDRFKNWCNNWKRT